MRRAMLTMVLAILTTAMPVSAQLFPTQPAPATERVLVDATIFVEPPDRPGLCLPLSAGQLTVTIKQSSDPIERRRTDFSLLGFQDDPEANVTIPVGRQSVTVATRINGSYHYCWQIEIDAPETDQMSHAGRGAYAHTVDVRITHRPD